MVRDPSIVSPSLAGCVYGVGHNKHDTGPRCTLLKQCRPPSPSSPWRLGLGDVGGGGGVTDRATRGACSAGSGWVEQFSLPQWVSFRSHGPQRLHPSAHVDSNHGRDGSFLLPSLETASRVTCFSTPGMVSARCCVSSSPDPVLRPVSVPRVGSRANRVQRVCACGPVLHARRCVRANTD